VGIHFVHVLGKGPNPLQLLLFHGWPDSFYRYHKVIERLTNIMIYWATETINTSIRTYYEEFHQPSLAAGQRIERWTQMPRGGHFAALEEPELLVEDLRAFYRSLR
jgi:hypothetical protein